jgi:hypothetical protein
MSCLLALCVSTSGYRCQAERKEIGAKQRENTYEGQHKTL